MKKLIVTVFLLTFLGNSGCKEFLTEVPTSTYSVSGGYKTPTDFKDAIMGAYAPLQNIFGNGISWFFALTSRCDDLRLPTSTAAYLDGIENFSDGDNNALTLAVWEYYYQIINRTSTILELIDGVEFTDTDLKTHIKGEAHALRAYAYWSLGWQFGGVPIVLNTITAEDARGLQRSTLEETFAQATDDYNKAIGFLPEEWGPSDRGRITKYAAQGMLARLHMFRSEFSSAIPLLKSIIMSDKYQLEPDYKNCFDNAFDNGRERVWEVQFMGEQSGEGSTFQSNFIGNILPITFTEDGYLEHHGNSGSLATDSLYNAYEPGDLRRDISIHIGSINQQNNIDKVSKRVIKWAHDSYRTNIRNDIAGNLPILRYTDVKMMYAEALNEMGYVQDDIAFEILNEVRRRAGLQKLTSLDLPTQQDFREAIIRERRVEFAFEGMRWRDLLRWGMAETVMHMHFSLPQQGSGFYSMKPHQKIFAIPFEVLNRYDNESIMWQNPGY